MKELSNIKINLRKFTKNIEITSDSALYHLAGDAICSTVLMAIFGKMLDIDWKEWWFNGTSL